MTATKNPNILVGIGLDNNDGHKRVTTGDGFTLVSGSESTHAEMAEKAIKINEKLKKKGKDLRSVSKEEFDDVAHSVGLNRRT